MQQELQIIMDLMKDLKDKMEYGEDDFSERLGRKKPDVEVMKIEAKPEIEGEGDMKPSPFSGMESASEQSMEDEDPDMQFKKRLMKLRG